MSNIINLNDRIATRERRMKDRAIAIANEIDPAAGGFFRRCLENAAFQGMKFIDEENANATEYHP